MPQLIAQKRIFAIELSNNSKNLQQAIAADDIDIASADERRCPHQWDASGKMLIAWPDVAFAASTASAAAAAVTGLSAMVA